MVVLQHINASSPKAPSYTEPFFMLWHWRPYLGKEYTYHGYIANNRLLNRGMFASNSMTGTDTSIGLYDFSSVRKTGVQFGIQPTCIVHHTLIVFINY